MKRLLFTASLLASLAPVVAAGTEVLGLADAVPGASGVCITEMDGGERVEIPVTILGTIGSGIPGGELILVRLDDPRFRDTGIIAGMSGSPVYIDGRLLGALAYGWPFSKQPIGGVTPFERMLEVSPLPARPTLPGRPLLREMLAASARGELGRSLVEWLLPVAPADLAPLPLAVSISGGSPNSQAGWLAEAWRRMGWVSTAGAGSGGPDVGPPIEPGAMVAGVLADGDVMIAAAGTVTEVRGDRLWAFGHTSLGAGSTEVPLARAEVVAVMPSLMSSFKFFTVGDQVGALVGDRAPGIVGELGRQAPMVPVQVAVNDDEYNFRAASHPVLLPLVAAYLTQASQLALGRTLGDQSIALGLTLEHEGRTSEVRASFAGGQAPLEAAAFVAAVLAYLEASSFQPPDLESLRVRLDVHEELRVASIVEIVPDRRVVRPGEELQLRFRLQPHRGPEVVQALSLRVPESTPPGRLDVVGSDGAAWNVYDLRMRPVRPSTFEEELALLERLEPASSLVAFLERRDLGIAVSGGQVSAPPSRVHALRSALGANLQTTAYSVVDRAVRSLPYVVSGAERVSLTVITD